MSPTPAPVFEWLLGVRRWLAGDVGPEGEQLALPGMPEPPASLVTRALPFVLATFANADGTGIRPGHRLLARILGVQDRAVRRAVDALVRDLGLLADDTAGHTAPGRAKTYATTSPDWLTAPKHRSRPTGEHRSPQTAVPENTGPWRPKHRSLETKTPVPRDRLPVQDQYKTRGNGADATRRRPPVTCARHPHGTDRPCRDCASARALHDAWVLDQQPAARPVGQVLDDSRACGHGYLDPAACPACRRLESA